MEISVPLSGNLDIFEKTHVKDVYEDISEHFDNTRHYSWDKVEEFVKNINVNTINFDIGCGNGRNMRIREDCHFIGFDITFNLLKKIEVNGNDGVQCSNLNLPVRDNVADNILSIAVIHHFATEERRLEAIKEMIRVLRIGGRILIYVWAKEQERFKNKSQDLLVGWKLQKRYSKDKKETDYGRYYHLFYKDEFEKLLKKITNIKIIEIGYQMGNWYCIAEKL